MGLYNFLCCVSHLEGCLKRGHRDWTTYVEQQGDAQAPLQKTPKALNGEVTL